MGPTQRIYRASCKGTEIRLRVNVDAAWLVIKRPGQPADYVDIQPKDIDELLRQFQAIKGDPGRFDEFVALGLLYFQNWKEQPTMPQDCV